MAAAGPLLFSQKQIGLPEYSRHNIPKLGKNYHKLSQIKPNVHKMAAIYIIQMAIEKYLNIFHSKALQNLPKSFFFV
jgi:hypothetical protein